SARIIRAVEESARHRTQCVGEVGGASRLLVDVASRIEGGVLEPDQALQHDIPDYRDRDRLTTLVREAGDDARDRRGEREDAYQQEGATSADGCGSLLTHDRPPPRERCFGIQRFRSGAASMRRRTQHRGAYRSDGSAALRTAS